MNNLKDWEINDFEEIRKKRELRELRNKEIKQIKTLNGVQEDEANYF